MLTKAIITIYDSLYTWEIEQKLSQNSMKKILKLLNVKKEKQ